MGLMDKYAIYLDIDEAERRLGKRSPLHQHGTSLSQVHSLPQINHKVQMFEKGHGVNRAVKDSLDGKSKPVSNYAGFGNEKKPSGSGKAIAIGAGAIGLAGLGALALKRHLDRKDDDRKNAALNFGYRYVV